MTYRVRAWWDRPGQAGPGEHDLGEGWARCWETATLSDAQVVARFLKRHPDAEGADVDELDDDGQVVGRYVAERTILGWLVSPESLDS